MGWPAEFLWGTGASSTQCEGAAPASDWYDWERAGHAPPSGEGNGFARRYAEDFSLLAGLGLRHHRLSLEWARLEPAPGEHDRAAVEHYRRVLASARDAGITPWLCLHHFTLPRWFADEGGFRGSTWRERWTRHVDFVAETFGDLAGGWQPVNETNYYAPAAYGGRGWPPGRADPADVAAVAEAITLATAEAAVRLRGTGKPVASIFGLATEVGLDDLPETATVLRRFRAHNWDAWLGLVRDGVVRIGGREPVERPDLVRPFDLLGFSYYATVGVAQGKVVPYPTGAPVSAMGYVPWPEGLGLVLRRLHEELPDQPLLVAEYGIGTDDDALRAAYLRKGLEVTQSALADGVDVRGFFHWTAVDNYEWLHGYDVAFGLIDRDRAVRPSARVLADEALRARPVG